MPVFTKRNKWVFPGVRVVSAYFPPAADVIVPLIKILSAVGGPLACKDAALTVNVVEWNQSLSGNAPRSISQSAVVGPLMIMGPTIPSPYCTE